MKRQRLVVKLSSRPVKVVNELPAISELQLSDQAYQPTQHQAVNPATVQEAMPLAGAFPEACKPIYGPGLPPGKELVSGVAINSDCSFNLMNTQEVGLCCLQCM